MLTTIKPLESVGYAVHSTASHWYQAHVTSRESALSDSRFVLNCIACLACNCCTSHGTNSNQNQSTPNAILTSKSEKRRRTSVPWATIPGILLSTRMTYCTCVFLMPMAVVVSTWRKPAQMANNLFAGEFRSTVYADQCVQCNTNAVFQLVYAPALDAWNKSFNTNVKAIKNGCNLWCVHFF